ncbi:MAG: hypothetical protein ACLFQV_11155, partial [Vulcanimicrobiota bacterium]
MNVSPSIVGPEIAINPSLVLTFFDDAQFPFPGVIVATYEPVLVFGENDDVALSLEYCTNFAIEGKTGKYDTRIRSEYEAGQVHIMGNYGEQLCDYFINPEETGFYIKGIAGSHNVELKTDFLENLVRCTGTIDKQEVNTNLKSISETAFTLRANVGSRETKIEIFFRDNEIKLSGVVDNNNVDYTITSNEDCIKTEGIMKSGFSKLEYRLEESEDEEFVIQAFGKSKKVPVDYSIALY